MRCRKEATINNVEKAAHRLTTEHLLKIIAYSITAISILPSDPFPVTKLTWQQLANRGILQIVDNVIILPFTLVLRCISVEDMVKDEVHRALICCLRNNMLELTQDKRATNWLRWEEFGAYFYAAKINSFVLLGESRVRAGTLLGSVELFEEGEILLKRAEVIKASDPLSVDTDLSDIREHNTGTSYDALEDDVISS